MCLYFEDNIDSSFQHFQQVLRLAPEHAKAMNVYKKAKMLKKKKDEGNEAYKLCKFNVSTHLIYHKNVYYIYFFFHLYFLTVLQFLFLLKLCVMITKGLLTTEITLRIQF